MSQYYVVIFQSTKLVKLDAVTNCDNRSIKINTIKKNVISIITAYTRNIILLYYNDYQYSILNILLNSYLEFFGIMTTMSYIVL